MKNDIAKIAAIFCFARPGIFQSLHHNTMRFLIPLLWFLYWYSPSVHQGLRLVDENSFCRVSPQEKIGLVKSSLENVKSIQSRPHTFSHQDGETSRTARETMQLLHMWCRGVAKLDLYILFSFESFILYQNFIYLFVKLEELLKKWNLLVSGTICSKNK